MSENIKKMKKETPLMSQFNKIKDTFPKNFEIKYSEANIVENTQTNRNIFTAPEVSSSYQDNDLFISPLHVSTEPPHNKKGRDF